MSFTMRNGITTIGIGAVIGELNVTHPNGGLIAIGVLKDGTIKYKDKIYNVEMPLVIRDNVVTFADGKTLPDVLGDDMPEKGERNVSVSSVFFTQ